MDDRGFHLAKVTEQVQRFGRPPGLELEVVPITTTLQLVLDRASLLVERTPIASARVGDQEQDGVFLHRRPPASVQRDHARPVLTRLLEYIAVFPYFALCRL